MKLDFGQAVQNAFFSLICGIGIFGVYFLKDLSKEISDMNAKIAVVLLNISASQETLRDHEERLRKIERHK